MPVQPKTLLSMQAKALYAKQDLRRLSFWRGFPAAVDCEPLIQATVRRAKGSRSFGDDFEAHPADRYQGISQLLNGRGSFVTAGSDRSACDDQA